MSDAKIVSIIPADGWFVESSVDGQRHPVACWALLSSGQVAGMLSDYSIAHLTLLDPDEEWVSDFFVPSWRYVRFYSQTVFEPGEITSERPAPNQTSHGTSGKG